MENMRMRKLKIPILERLRNYVELQRLRLLICFSHVLNRFASLCERERHTKDQDLHKRSTKLARIIMSRTMYNKQNQFRISSRDIIKNIDLQIILIHYLNTL